MPHCTFILNKSGHVTVWWANREQFVGQESWNRIKLRITNELLGGTWKTKEPYFGLKTVEQVESMWSILKDIRQAAINSSSS